MFKKKFLHTFMDMVTSRLLIMKLPQHLMVMIVTADDGDYSAAKNDYCFISLFMRYVHSHIPNITISMSSLYVIMNNSNAARAKAFFKLLLSSYCLHNKCLSPLAT